MLAVSPLRALAGAADERFYWENPAPLTAVASYFPEVVTASDGSCSWCFFEEVLPEEGGGQLYVSVQRSTGGSWSKSRRVAGPFRYGGDVPDCFSVAESRGILVLAVASGASDRTLRVYTSRNGADSFAEQGLSVQEQTVVGPRLFAAKNGSFMLFASLGAREVAVDTERQQYERFAFSLVSSVSPDGASWTPLEPFEPSLKLSNPFSPFLCPTDEGDVVVFQAQYESERMPRLSNQLYVTVSRDGLASWSAAALLSGEESVPLSSGYTFAHYHNQRPYLCFMDGRLHLLWERTLYTTESSSIWAAELAGDGSLAGAVEQISLYGSAHRPVLFGYRGTLYALWFDNRRGVDSVSAAAKKGLLWTEDPFSFPQGTAVQRFVYPVLEGGGLSFLWQQQGGGGKKPLLYVLEHDRSVKKPALQPLSFTAGKRSTAEKVRARVVLPDDSSGIAGYSWIWTQDKDAQPPKKLMSRADDNALTARAPGDGVWYFKARALDYAGNWSESASLRYHRDLTPPRPPLILPLSTDEYGFISSNTFSMRWKDDGRDDDIAGYSWSLEYMAPLEKSLWENRRHPLESGSRALALKASALRSDSRRLVRRASPPPPRLLGKSPSAAYTNRTNGLYVFSVCAVDQVGNVGKPAVIPLLLNKYEPSTSVLSLSSQVDEFGTLDLAVSGRGFTYDGTVTEVYLDRDGLPPYDIRLSEAAGEYTVASDELIRGIHIENADAGLYKIGLFHSDRGLYFSDKTLKIDEYGTVKLQTPYSYQPDWKPLPLEEKPGLPAFPVIFAALLAFAALALAGTGRALAGAMREAAQVRQEVRAILTGGMMLQEQKKAAASVAKRRSSLRVKFSIFTVQGVLVVAVLIALPLGLLMVRAQSRTLASGLEERVRVVLDSIASGVRLYLPAQNDLELSSLPGMISMKEVRKITILALPREMNNTNLNYVWATNDDGILDKIDSSDYVQGASRYTDRTALSIISRFGALNEEALLSVGDMTQRINELTAEGTELALRNDSSAVTRRGQINDQVRLLSNRSLELLSELSDKASGSVPAFDTQRLDFSNTSYLFYKPVLFRQGSEPLYVRAVILLEVSTEALIQNIARTNRTLIFVALVVTLIVTLIGVFSSLVFVSVLVRPIRQLVEHVEIISRTRRKETLAGMEIPVKSRDEIGLLGETVNEMTRGLVKAALDENLLMDGKAVQQAFIPLQVDEHGNHITTAGLRDEAVQIFGYYEGASGVSGDYFDYKKLDDRWYCLIKCDVSGHGVPAALIMTVVATMFRQYFDSWSWRINGTALEKLVTNINDFIESLGLKGKFTALMVCLLDTRDGDVYLCNAGDNLIHYYDRSESRERTVSLSQTPAAGSLPSFMVDMKGGFSVDKLRLESGDVLFLYTDGIEESTRKFRRADFSVEKCREGEEGAVHGNHRVGEESEQLSPDRIQGIIESVFARKSYRLDKYHNPVAGEQLLFDFTGCEGTVKDAVLALASVEKVFRMYKSPDCTESDLVRVDRKIDSFLQEHFNLYDTYCRDKVDNGEANYLYYTHLREDEQLDDLTLLAVQKA